MEQKEKPKPTIKKVESKKADLNPRHLEDFNALLRKIATPTKPRQT